MPRLLFGIVRESIPPIPVSSGEPSVPTHPRRSPSECLPMVAGRSAQSVARSRESELRLGPLADRGCGRLLWNPPHSLPSKRWEARAILLLTDVSDCFVSSEFEMCDAHTEP